MNNRRKLNSYINSTLTIERLIQSGDHIAAVGWTSGTVNANGAQYHVPIVHLWQVYSGQIVRTRFCIDHPTMFPALAGHRTNP